MLVDGDDVALVRRVDSQGTITTIAGGGSRDASSGCLRPTTPARAVRLRSPRTIALPDTSILIVTGDVTYHLSADGGLTPVMCVTSPLSSPAPNDVYWDGGSALRPRTAVADSVAVTSDGGLLIKTPRHVALVPPLDGGRRLGAALPATKSQEHLGRSRHRRTHIACRSEYLCAASYRSARGRASADQPRCRAQSTRAPAATVCR